MGRHAISLLAAAAAVVSGRSTRAFAQDTAAGQPAAMPSPAETAACIPACREGYVCVDGRCLSACNPPCTAYQVCTAAGTCETPPPPSGWYAPPAAGAPPPPVRGAPRRGLFEVRIGVGLGVLAGTYSGTSEFASGSRSAISGIGTFQANAEFGLNVSDWVHVFGGLRIAAGLSKSDCTITGVDAALELGGTFFFGPELGLTVAGAHCGSTAEIDTGNGAMSSGTISFNGNAISAWTVGGRAGLRLAPRARRAFVPEVRFFTNAATISAAEVRLYPNTGASDGILSPTVRWYGGTLGLMYAF